MNIQKLQNELMMKNMLFRPLWDLVDVVGYQNISKADKKDYQILAHEIKKLDKKIDLLIKDKLKLVY